MMISIQQVADYVFTALQEHRGPIGLPVYKRKLPKGVKSGLVIVSTDITFEQNQRSIFFVLAYVPDIKSGGDYEVSPRLKEVAQYFAANLSVIRQSGTSYRCELIGQSEEEAEDTTSHFVSNKYMFYINTE